MPILIIGDSPFVRPCLPGLREQFREESDFFCDAAVLVDGRRFVAHRNVLAGSSLFFEGLYTSNCIDSRGAMMLVEVSASSFEAVLAWIYEGECTVASPDELVPLLQAADRLQVLPLRDAAERAVATRLTSDSCVGAWDLADKLCLPILEMEARKTCLLHWRALSSAPEKLGQLSAKNLHRLLQDDELPAKTETEVLEAIVRWADSQAQPLSEEVVVQLVANVRFARLSSEEWERIAMKESLLQTTNAMQAVLLSRMTGCTRARVDVIHSIEFGPAGEAVWTIGNYSGISLDHVGKIVSPTFELGNQSWNLWNLHLYPNGQSDKHNLALFLNVPEAKYLPNGWSRKKVRMTLEVKNQLTQAKTISHSFDLCFKEGASNWGWPAFVKLKELRDMAKGFVVEEKLIVTARMQLLVPSNSHAIADEAVAVAS